MSSANQKSHPGNFYPPLQQTGSLVGLECRVAQAGGDDTVGDRVELGHGGPDGGSQVLLTFLIPLRPNPPQAVVGNHLLEQILNGRRERGELKSILISNLKRGGADTILRINTTR